uniref:S2 protein n=21 Tax=Equine infectious anemia virus TaxID=11665 RepID=K7WE26_9RETR|nr:S2 protein [Equine infectious anemia virus]AFW99178.1 S2 protein [Equine infectious anemia virus]AFW99184.1 S2 protein [Equine infectious anemia virus]AIU56814.1 s2 protein [Equine infectious anemia virus]
MGLFGKGVTWSASPSMGESQGESKPLLCSNQNPKVRDQKKGIMRYFSLTVMIAVIKPRWLREETQDTKKK